MVRDEALLLPRWLEYYGQEVGPGNLYVIDDATQDGSTHDIEASVLRLPDYRVGEDGRPVGETFAQRRAPLVSHLVAGLLQYYDQVVVSDVDEFLVPHPDRASSLREYLSEVSDQVVAGVGLNLVHNLAREAPFRPDLPILRQRRHVKFVPVMCKPLVVTHPVQWTAGFHGCDHAYRIDPDLLLIHLKFMDLQLALDQQGRRYSYYRQEGRGGRRSTWPSPPSEMATRAVEWMTPDGPVADLATDTLPLRHVVRTRESESVWRSRGATQTTAMERHALMRLPESLGAPF
jgi:hypothetical protein